VASSGDSSVWAAVCDSGAGWRAWSGGVLVLATLDGRPASTRGAPTAGGGDHHKFLQATSAYFLRFSLIRRAT